MAVSALGALVPSQGDRIVVYGDSISTPTATTPGMNPHYLASFYILRYPTVTQHWRYLGRSGMQITNTYGSSSDPFARYDEYIIGLRPTKITYLMTPNGSHDTNTFWKALEFMVTNRFMGYSTTNYAGGANPYLFGCFAWNTASADTASGLMHTRSSIHAALGAANSWAAVDLWLRSYAAISNNFAAGTPDLGWAPDGEHPGLAGHLGLAYNVLDGLGEDGLVSTAFINATAQTSSLKTNCTINSLSSTATNVSFVRLDTKLPMAWDASATEAAIAVWPGIITNMNRYMLYVSNLSAGTYTLTIDGTSCGSVTSTQLLSGFNLTTLTNGPIRDQLTEVLGRIRDAQGINRVTFATLAPTQGQTKYTGNCTIEWNAGKRDGELIAAVSDEDALTDGYDELIRAAAQPVSRTFTLTLQGAGGGGGGGATSSSERIVGSGTIKSSGTITFR